MVRFQAQGSEARGSSRRPPPPKAPGSFRHTHARTHARSGCTQSWAGPSGSRGCVVGWVGTGKRIPFLRPPRTEVQYS